MWNASLIDGPIVVPVLDAEGVQTGAETGYHLNVSPEIMDADLEKFRITPGSPERTFAGAETVFLKFKTEAAAKKAMPGYWIDPVADVEG